MTTDGPLYNGSKIQKWINHNIQISFYWAFKNEMIYKPSK